VPLPFPPEFRQRAVELTRQGEIPVSKIAKYLEISVSCPSNLIHQADAGDGQIPGQLADGKKRACRVPASQ
jgi:transposase